MKNTKMLALVILLVAAVAIVLRFWSVAMLFFAAAVIAYLLSPLVRLLTFRGKVPRGVAVAITALLVLGLIVWLIALLVPYAVNQISGVVNDLDVYAKDFDKLLLDLNELLASWHLPQQVLDWAYSFAGKLDAYLGRAFTGVLNWLTSTVSSLFDIIVVIILIIYFMLDGKKLVGAAVNALPQKMAVRAASVLRESDGYVWKYIGTRVLISLGMGLVSYIGFTIIGLRYALLFALVSFVLDFIPYFGSLIAGVVEGVYAIITGGLSLAIKVVIFVLVVQQIEGNVVAPKLQGEAVDVHPIAIMFSLLVCSELWGPVGMLISTPVAAVVKVFIREVYRYIVGNRMAPAAADGGIAPPPEEKSEPETPAKHDPAEDIIAEILSEEPEKKD